MIEHRLTLKLDKATKDCTDSILKLDPKEPGFTAEFAVIKGRYMGLQAAKQYLKECSGVSNLDGDED